MKVTVFTLEYPPNVYGGAGVHVKYLTESLAKRIEVEVRTLGTCAPEYEKISDSLIVRRYRPRDFASGRGFMRSLEALSLDIGMVKDIIDSEIVHSHTWYCDMAGFYAKTLYDAKFVATVHSLEPLRPWKEKQLGTGYRLSTWMERTALEECDRIIAVSEEMKNDVHRVYGTDISRISVIHNGIDAEKFRKVNGEKTLNELKIKEPYILFVGRLTPQKGVFDLIEAFRHVKDADLVLVTGKPDTADIEERLKKEINETKNLHWLNRMLSEGDLVSLYSEAEVFVCPSIYEPFGIINLESMACKTPVVATSVGGIKDVVVDGETGILVPPGNPEELAEGINIILSDKGLAEKMGMNGRKRVEKEFTWDSIAAKTINLYEKIVG